MFIRPSATLQRTTAIEQRVVQRLDAAWGDPPFLFLPSFLESPPGSLPTIPSPPIKSARFPHPPRSFFGPYVTTREATLRVVLTSFEKQHNLHTKWRGSLDNSVGGGEHDPSLLNRRAPLLCNSPRCFSSMWCVRPCNRSTVHSFDRSLFRQNRHLWSSGPNRLPYVRTCQLTPAGLVELHQKGRCCWRTVIASCLRRRKARRLCRRSRNSPCAHAHSFGRDTTIRARDNALRRTRIKGGGGAGTNAWWSGPNLLHAVYLTPARRSCTATKNSVKNKGAPSAQN